MSASPGNKKAQAERSETLREFKQAVNMSAHKLEAWLKTDESKEVGVTHEGEHESVGHQSGRRIIELLGKRQAEFDDDDLDHMRKVVGFVHRHLRQRPEGDVRDTRWRWSLMNWGHDPARD